MGGLRWSNAFFPCPFHLHFADAPIVIRLLVNICRREIFIANNLINRAFRQLHLQVNLEMR